MRPGLGSVQQAIEPDLIERDPQSRRLSHGRRPERRHFRGLVPRSEAAGLRGSSNEGTQAGGAWVAGAGLPRLDRVVVHVQSRRELALGQPDPPAKLQDQPTKAVARVAKGSRHQDAPHRHPEDDNAGDNFWHAHHECSQFGRRTSISGTQDAIVSEPDVYLIPHEAINALALWPNASS